MSWQAINITNDNPCTLRFLIDERLEPQLAVAFRKVADTLTFTFNNGTSADVIKAAGRECRILLSQDRGFLDESKLPSHRSPGVIVLPATEDAALIGALVKALPLLQKDRAHCEGLKIVVNDKGRVIVIDRDEETGRPAMRRYKLRIGGPPLTWM